MAESVSVTRRHDWTKLMTQEAMAGEPLDWTQRDLRALANVSHEDSLAILRAQSKPSSLTELRLGY